MSEEAGKSEAFSRIKSSPPEMLGFRRSRCKGVPSVRAQPETRQKEAGEEQDQL
jgi:hypothetical protein